MDYWQPHSGHSLSNRTQRKRQNHPRSGRIKSQIRAAGKPDGRAVGVDGRVQKSPPTNRMMATTPSDFCMSEDGDPHGSGGRRHAEPEQSESEILQCMDPDDLDEQPQEPLQGPLLTEPISSLKLGPPITVPLEATLQQTVEVMQNRHLGCMLIVDGNGVLKGIFTERDLLTKVAGRKLDWTSIAVSEFMTADPESLQSGDGTAWALNVMCIGGYRHAP